MAYDTWQTVELGRYSSSHKYIQSMESQGQKVGDIARGFVQSLELAVKRTQVDLVRVKSSVLNLKDPAETITRICEDLVAGGLNYCRPEVALALREQYADQPSPEILWVATEPLRANDHFNYFAVTHEHRGRWLTLGCGGPSCSWGVWRRKWFSPRIQERIVPMSVCECPWSRQQNPVYMIFEK